MISSEINWISYTQPECHGHSIASSLGVSRTTIYRRWQMFGMNTDQAHYAFSNIPDCDLDAMLTFILSNSPPMQVKRMFKEALDQVDYK